jgi:hypothetical protein
LSNAHFILKPPIDPVEVLVPELEGIGSSCRVIATPVSGQSPFLLAERIEAEAGFLKQGVFLMRHARPVTGEQFMYDPPVAPSCFRRGWLCRHWPQS